MLHCIYSLIHIVPQGFVRHIRVLILEACFRVPRKHIFTFLDPTSKSQSKYYTQYIYIYGCHLIPPCQSANKNKTHLSSITLQSLQTKTPSKFNMQHHKTEIIGRDSLKQKAMCFPCFNVKLRLFLLRFHAIELHRVPHLSLPASASLDVGHMPGPTAKKRSSEIRWRIHTMEITGCWAVYSCLSRYEKLHAGF